MSKKPASQKPNWGPATVAIHGTGKIVKAYHAVSTPIVQTSNYSFENTTEVLDFMTAKAQGRIIREHEYGRYFNPTQQEVERKLAAIEGAERAITFSSGMSALILTVLAYVKKGGHVVFTSDCYRQTRNFANNWLTKFGIESTFVDPTPEAIENAIRPNTNLIFTELPTNPFLRVIDLAAIVKVAKRHKLLTVVDSTLATPYNIRPLEMGVDIVIHSATKYLGGHNDLVAGVALGSHALLEDLNKLERMFGATPGPHSCFLLERGLKTFDLRMEQHNKSGLAVAKFFEAHPRIEKVFYPGLQSHPDYKVAKKLMRGNASVISILVKGNNKATCRFIDALKLFLITP